MRAGHTLFVFLKPSLLLMLSSYIKDRYVEFYKSVMLGKVLEGGSTPRSFFLLFSCHT